MVILENASSSLVICFSSAVYSASRLQQKAEVPTTVQLAPAQASIIEARLLETQAPGVTYRGQCRFLTFHHGNPAFVTNSSRQPRFKGMVTTFSVLARTLGSPRALNLAT